MKTVLTTFGLSQLTKYNEIYQYSNWGKTTVKIKVCWEMNDEPIKEYTGAELEEILDDGICVDEELKCFIVAKSRNWFAEEFRLKRYVENNAHKKVEVFENLELYKKEDGTYILLISLAGDEYDESAKRAGLHKTNKLHSLKVNSYYKEFHNKPEFNKYLDSLNKGGNDKFNPISHSL